MNRFRVVICKESNLFIQRRRHSRIETVYRYALATACDEDGADDDGGGEDAAPSPRLELGTQ